MNELQAKTVRRIAVLLGAVGLVIAMPLVSPAQAPARKLPPLAIVDEQKIDINRFLCCVAISPDAKLMAAGEDNVHLYDITGLEPKPIAVLETRVFTCVRNMVFSPDGKRLAMGG